MLYLLFGLTVAFTGVFYRANGKKVFSVTFISCAMYIVCEATAIAAKKFYNTDITLDTVLLVVFSLFFLGLGELAMSNKGLVFNSTKKSKLNTRKEQEFTQSTPIRIPKLHVIILSLFLLVIAFLKFRSILQFAASNGISGNYLLVFGRVRSYMTHGYAVYSMGTVLSQLNVFSTCCSYLFCYVFLYNRIICGYKNTINLLPVIAEFFVILPSTGRTDYIRLFAVFFVIFILFYLEKNNWISRNNRKILLYCLLGIIGFIIVFRLAGRLTGKSSFYGFAETIYRYVGAGIYGLDAYIRHPQKRSVIFAQKTLYSLRNILNHLLGMHLDLGNQFNDAITIPGNNVETVMYTGLYVPLHEFGLLYLFATRMLIGAVYTGLINNFRKVKTRNVFSYIFFGWAFYPVIMGALDDGFPGLIAYSVLYMLFYLIILKRFFIDRNMRRNKERESYGYK